MKKALILTILTLASILAIPAFAQSIGTSTNYIAICLPCSSNANHVVVNATNSYVTASNVTIWGVRQYLEVRNPNVDRVHFTRGAVSGVMSTNILYLNQNDAAQLADSSVPYNGPISMCTTGSVPVNVPVEEAFRQ